MEKSIKCKKSELNGKTVLIVNTGSIKKRFILQRIKKLGINTVVLNKEKNWADSYVDHWILADTANHAESMHQVSRFFKENPKLKIDGILTFWEDDVLLTSKLCDKFNHIGIPFGIAKTVRDKAAFREKCRELCLPHAKSAIIKTTTEIKKIVNNLSFPMVIKPVFGSSSAYVIKIENEEELRKSYKYIKKEMSLSAESALTDGSDIMVEEYIDGYEVDIDIIIQNGRIKFHSISDNNKTNEPFFIETGQSIPSNLPDEDQSKLRSMAYESLEKFGIQNGCIHFEAKVSKRGPVPIEINLRMGGDEVYSFVKEAWHFDLIENALMTACGIYIDEIDKPHKPYKYLAGKYFLTEYSGVLSKLFVDKEDLKKKYIEDFQIFKKVGDTILVPPDGYEYIGWITVSGDNAPEASDNLNEALKKINFEIVKFHSMSSIGKTQRKNKFSFSTLGKKEMRGSVKIEKIRASMEENQRNLHIGIACNKFVGESGEESVEKELANVGANIEKTLKDRGYRTTFFDFNNVAIAYNDLKKSDVDMVFNVCERINNSSLLEPHAASMLDILQIPYTGSNPFTLGLCIDKIRVKKLLSYHNIPTPNWDYIYDINDKVRTDLRYPLIVKPANTDNSLGITNDSVVTNPKELEEQLKKVLKVYKRPALIEEYIEGDEYDVSIIGSEEEDQRILPLSRSVFDKLPDGYWHIYPFEAKFTDDPIYKHIEVQRPPKKINKKLEALLGEIALDTYNILDCHDYGRVEIRVDKDNNPYVLELNPNPSINIGDCVPSVAGLAGYDYGDFLEEIIRIAIIKYKNNPPYYHLQANII